MNETGGTLPSSQELLQLPLRALVAYALRASRRLLEETNDCNNSPSSVLLDEVGGFVENADIDQVSLGAIALGASDVAGAEAVGANTELKIGIAVRATAMCCCHAIQACKESGADQIEQHEKAARSAHRAARQLKRKFLVDIQAKDYERCMQTFGAQATVCLGEPFDSGRHGPLGELLPRRLP